MLELTLREEAAAIPNEAASHRPRVWWVTAAIALAGIFGWLATRSVKWHDLIAVLRHARVGLLLLSMGVASFSYLIRALRWQGLLRVEHRIGFWPVFWANSAGNLGNTILPARAGELLRTVMISAHSGLSKAFVLSTAFSERLADVLALLLLAGFVNSVSHVLPPTLRPMNAAVLAIACIGVLFFCLPRRLEDLGNLLANILPERLRERAVQFVRQAAAGVRSLHSYRRLAIFGSLTLVIWLLDAYSTVIAGWALGLSVPFALALLLLAALGLSSIIPALPGQIGLFQFITIEVMATAGMDHTHGLMYGLVLQAGSFLVIGFLGLIGIWKHQRSDLHQGYSTINKAP